MNVQRLVAFLALSERPVSRGRLAAVLWPDTSEARAGSNLRSALWRLRASAPGLVRTGAEVRLSGDVSVDIHGARALARELTSSSQAAEWDLASFHLDLLPDWYDDWALVERERFRQVRLHALEAACELLTRQGSYGAAVDAGLAAVAGEPLRETAQRVLIRAHLAEGNLGEAVRQFRRYRELLQSELGVEPSLELEQLVRVPRL